MSLKLVTFNIACGYLFTTNRPERMRAIGALIRDADPDLVGLQEAFTRRDRGVLLQALSGSRLVHRARFPAGVVGNGLLTLSAFPIIARAFHRYRHSSPWYKVHQGDWWAGKGIGLARVQLPGGRQVDFHNTHTQPDRGDAANVTVRHHQLQEFARFVNATREPGIPTLIAGDFNTGIDAGDLRQAMALAALAPAMTRGSDIDFLLAGDDPSCRVQAIDTAVLAGSIPGHGSALFLDRAPTPRELWRMHRGPAQTTALSDHPGYLSRVTIEFLTPMRDGAGRRPPAPPRARSPTAAPHAAIRFDCPGSGLY